MTSARSEERVKVCAVGIEVVSLEDGTRSICDDTDASEMVPEEEPRLPGSASAATCSRVFERPFVGEDALRESVMQDEGARIVCP